MNTFREQLENDLDVFVNADEFSEMHVIQGVEVQAVLEGLTSKQVLTTIARNSAEYEGIDGRTVIVHLKSAALPDDVVQGNIVEVDGEVYRVVDVVEDMGLTTLTLGVDAV